jgi:hypothetical protein
MVYDFGDGWRHEVVLEKVNPGERLREYSNLSWRGAPLPACAVGCCFARGRSS